MTPEEIKAYKDAYYQRKIDDRERYKLVFAALRDYWKTNPGAAKKAIKALNNAIEYNLKEGK